MCRIFVESIPNKNSFDEESIKWPKPLIILLINWHWAFEEEKVYLHIFAKIEPSYPITKYPDKSASGQDLISKLAPCMPVL